MLVYNYDPDTFIYTGQSEADQSPLDPPGTWLIPAFATEVGPPPEPQEGYATTFDGEQWTNVLIPPPPEPEPVPLTTADVDAERDRRASQVAFQGKVFQSGRPNSFTLIAAWGSSANFAVQDGKAEGDLRWADPDKDFVWIDTANADVPMDAPTMKAFAEATMQWDSANILAGRDVKNMDPIPEDYTDDKYWPARAAR